MSTIPIVGITDQFSFATLASPSTFTVLDGVDSIAFSGDKVNMEKNTTMASTDGVDTFNASTQDPGSVDVKAFFYPGNTSQVALEAIRLSGAAIAMKVSYGSSNTCTFTGIVESFTPSYPLDKNARLDIKIKISGPRVFA
jgi:hypothetical protein